MEDIDALMTRGLWQFAANPLPLTEQEARNTAVVNAYARLSTNADFRLIMEDMLDSILLKACMTPEEEGERRHVLKMLTVLRYAGRAQRQQEEL